jgi:hypothetical protein
MTGNVTAQEEILMIQATPRPDVFMEAPVDNLDVNSCVIGNSIVYIAGYVVRKLSKLVV